MSGCNQLDEVRYCHIEPFGHVAPRNALDGWVYLVGKDKAADVLVRSSLPCADWGSQRSLRTQIEQLHQSAEGLWDSFASEFAHS
jgi:hypothetical protein